MDDRQTPWTRLMQHDLIGARAPRPVRIQGAASREFIALAEAALVLARLGHFELTHSVVAIARAHHAKNAASIGRTFP